MVGPVQLGALAACIVLFVPMAMAGWHLSRNKMLFFSGALFITLAVFVHLTPYFPLLFFNNNINSNSIDIDNGNGNGNGNSFAHSSSSYDGTSKLCVTLLHNVKFSLGLGDEKSSRVDKIGSLDRVGGGNIDSNEGFDSLSVENSNNVAKTGSLDRVDGGIVESNEDVEKSNNVGKYGFDHVGSSEYVNGLSDEKSGNVEKIGSWSWVDDANVIACGFQKLGRRDSSDLLNGSWVVVAGDSQARLFSVSLLGLVLGEEKMQLVRGDMFKRHSNYHIEINEAGMRVDFVWAPYLEEINDLVKEFKKNASYPDVFVMGAGLWHMLHEADPSAYGSSLRKLKNSLYVFGSPHMFWLGMPNLVNSMLNTEEKRKKMTVSAVKIYDKELYESELLKREKVTGGPLLMIDVETLSRKCGRKCTVDGMHYDDIVYEAGVHILLNALLIESHQKLS